MSHQVTKNMIARGFDKSMKSAPFYHLYVRSFYDLDCDGVGDIGEIEIKFCENIFFKFIYWLVVFEFDLEINWRHFIRSTHEVSTTRMVMKWAIYGVTRDILWNNLVLIQVLCKRWGRCPFVPNQPHVKNSVIALFIQLFIGIYIDIQYRSYRIL